jgi:RNA polymerase sigma factor (TIGR02999 family)
MPLPTDQSVTVLLKEVGNGNPDALDQLFPLVYDELRRIARQRLMRKTTGDTMNTTALVHEAYLRLTDQNNMSVTDRAHFYALSSVAMRSILVDYARSRLAEKRGGGKIMINLDDANVAIEDRAAELLALDECLERLAQHNTRLGKVVEYKFFGGLTYDEIGAVLGVSAVTIKRDWQFARAWLYKEMHSEV